MRKKNQKDNKGKKIPQQPNTFVPQSLLASIREQKLISCPEDIQDKILKYIPFAQPFEIPPEWVEKSEEDLNNELLPEELKLQQQQQQEIIQKTIEKKPNKPEKKNQKDQKSIMKKETIEIKEDTEKEEEEIKEPEIIIPSYNDNMHEELIKNLPLSLLKITKNNFVWLRPEDYVVNEILDKEIKRLYPKKKYIQMREDIKETYKIEKELSKLKEGEENKNFSEEENVDAFMNDDSETLKKTIYKDFYKLLENKPKIKVVNSSEREETHEEFIRRVNTTIERQKDALNKFKLLKTKTERKPIIQKAEEFQKINIYNLQPSNIDVKQIIDKEKLCRSFKEKNDFRINYSFISWLSSIYQFILDLQINDCITLKSIFNNIYPQENGSPIYNPNGHYAIKLYFMGKPRRIDIDDRMPCNVNGEFIFPRCEDLSELWPALLTKALLKLNIYKVRHPFYSKFEENVDTSYIYELTGYHTQIIQNLNQERDIQNLLYNNLSDDNYVNKKKYILCLNLFNPKKENDKKDKYYEEVIESYNNLKDYFLQKEGNQNLNKSKHIGLIKEVGIIEEDEENTKSNENKNDVNKPKITTLKNSFGLGKTPNPNIHKYSNESKIPDFTKKTFSPFRFGEKSNFKFILGKENITEAYWKSRDVKQRAGKRQKTISLKGKLFIDNKIEIIYNFAYSINDFFSNGNFNMSRLKALDFEDLKRNLKANNVVFKQLNQLEKREYIKQRKILKAKQLDIKNQRIEQLQNEGKPFLIIKIKSDSSGQYKINSVLMYSEDEIYMAKKCILNNWKYPPPDFFSKHFKKYEDSNEENEKINDIKNSKKKKKISAFDWTKENYIQLIGGDLSKFENNEENNVKEPIQKTAGGNWMSFSDFISLFNTFLVLHNPNTLFTGGKIVLDNNWLDYKIDCFEPLDDFMVLKLKNEEIENKEKSYIAFIIFEPNNDKTLKGKDKINNYIIFDIVDENHNTLYKNITMNRFYSTHIVDNLSGNLNYYIIIRGGIYQFGFYLELYSEGHKIENMTYQNYLCQSLDYKLANFKIEHPIIGNEPFYLLTRLHIIPNVNEDGSQIPDGEIGDFNIVINIKYQIKHLKKFIKLFIQKEEKDNNKFNDGKEIFINEQIHLNEGSYLIAIYFQNLPMSIKENTCDIDVVYSNKNYNIEQIDNIDYYEVGENYKHNKYNIVFKEKIYACDTIYASFNIQLRPKENSIDDKFKLIFLLYQLADKENEEVSFIEKKFAHGIRGNLLKKFESFNSIIIPNIKFKGGLIIPEKLKTGKSQVISAQTEPQFYPYLLICYIDDSFDINNSLSSLQNKLSWRIRVFSSDNLCFIPDLSKEENEKLLKNEWEEKEPGRANLAKMSRKRYNLEKMRIKGEELNKEDLAFLNIQRIRKTSKSKDEMIEQSLKQLKTKKISKYQMVSKKIEDKDTKKEEAKDLVLNFNKLLPRDIHHQSLYIKNYLKYAYKDRTKEINTIGDQYLKVINTEKIQTEKTKNITESMELYNKNIKTEMSSTFYKTQQPKDEMFSTFYKLDVSTRTSENDMLRELMKSRDSLKSQFKEKMNAKNAVSDILKNYIVNGYDYSYMLQVYKDTVEILGKENDDEIKLFKLLSNKKEDEIKNQLKKFTAKDKNNITKLIEEIEFNQLIISEEIMSKLREFIK